MVKPGVDIASTITLMFAICRNHLWNEIVSSATALQPCPLPRPPNKGVLAIFLHVYNVKISRNAGWSNIVQLGNVLHDNLGPNDPIVWDRDCPLCRLEKLHLYPYFIKVGESETTLIPPNGTFTRLWWWWWWAVMLWIGTIVPEPAQ